MLHTIHISQLILKMKMFKDLITVIKEKQAGKHIV